MANCEKLNRLLQVNKRTGEIKTCEKPQYRGHNLWDVYGRYSCEKGRAYYCKDLLYEIADYVFSYGITSYNAFKFTFAGVFQTGNIKYVLVCTAGYDRVYILEEK